MGHRVSIFKEPGTMNVDVSVSVCVWGGLRGGEKMMGRDMVRKNSRLRAPDDLEFWLSHLIII